MNRVINCPCGYVVHGETEEVLITQAQKHAKDVHAMELTREQAQSMIQPA